MIPTARLFARSGVQRALVLLLVVSWAVSAQAARNVILMIGDGMGQPQVEAGRIYRHGSEGRLAMEEMPYQARVRTTALDYPITDSAAAATALASGVKTTVGRLGQSANGVATANVLELAQARGRWGGVATNTTLTHATPAGFLAHVDGRGRLDEIARQIVMHSRPRLALGGGSHPNQFPPRWREEAARQGYRLIHTRQEMLSGEVRETTLLLGMFAPGSLAYHAQRKDDSSEPTLSEITRFSLDFMARAPQGFFLMVEGGRIDHACHANDEKLLVEEMAEFDRCVEIVRDWSRSHPDTLVLVTADHETGGLQVMPGAYPAGTVPRVRWHSTKHTDADVPLYAEGPGAENVYGTLDNTAIAYLVAEALGVALPATIEIQMAAPPVHEAAH